MLFRTVHDRLEWHCSGSVFTGLFRLTGNERISMLLEAQGFQDLLSQWNRCHGAFYQIRECDLLWNMNEQELVSYQILVCDSVPILAAMATKVGVAHGIPSNTFWLALYGKISEGRERVFVDALELLAKSFGKTRVAVGSDEFHFLPGLPDPNENGSRLKEAFLAAGFQGVDAVDFVGDLNTPPISNCIRAAEDCSQKNGWTFSPAQSEKDLGDLENFLTQDFSGRWKREFLFWRGREDAVRATWMLLRSSDEILGFARCALRGRIPNLQAGWTPGALRFALSSEPKEEGWLNTDACLGPIGMAKSQRGKGAGKILLGLTLSELARNNGKRLCIDWTNAYNYYMPLGVEVARNYWTSWKSSSA